MINKKYLKNLRCKEINKKNEFILNLYNARIIDSLDVIALEFKNILILGDQGALIYEYLRKRFHGSQLIVYDVKDTSLTQKIEIKKETIDLDLWLPKNNEFDLIISNFFLNYFNYHF